MKKVRMVLSWWIPIVLISVALMTPAVTQAKSIKIWPDQLRPYQPIGAYYQSELEARNGNFGFPLNLPVGATITKVTAYFDGYNGESSFVSVWRIKMEDWEGENSGTIADGSSNDSTGAVIAVDIPIQGDRIIRAGYRYFVQVFTPDELNIFRGMKITYKE